MLARIIDIEANPRPLRDWLCELILQEKWEETKAVAEECAEKWEKKSLNIIKNMMDKSDPFGRPQVFTLSTSSDYLIQGAAFIDGSESEVSLRHKKSRARIFRILAAIQELSYEEFERFCTKIISELGAETPTTTRLRADEGIGFFGRLRLKKHIFPDDLAPTLQMQLNVWLIGQAKH